jgi:hypothetical protein
MKVIWEIKDKSGKVVKRKEENKLATKNFVRLLAKIFTSSSVTLIDHAGAGRSWGVATTVGIGGANAIVKLGTGTTSPTRDDYNIVGSEIARGNVSVSPDEAGGLVTISASFTFTADTLVNEAGLFAYIPVGNNYFLMDRFLIQQTILAGQTLTISWVIDLSAL